MHDVLSRDHPPSFCEMAMVGTLLGRQCTCCIRCLHVYQDMLAQANALHMCRPAHGGAHRTARSQPAVAVCV